MFFEEKNPKINSLWLLKKTQQSHFDVCGDSRTYCSTVTL